MKSAYMTLVVCTFLCSATAKDLTWKGATNNNNWDTSTANWVLTGTTTPATFADGDNVLIESGKYSNSSLMMTMRVKPGDVVFDISDTFLFGWQKREHGLDVDTKSFTKRGTGTLILTSELSGSAANAGGDTQYGNAMTCGVEIAEGEIALKDPNSANYLGPRTVPYWVYVRNGASLTFLAWNQTGRYIDQECGIQIQLDKGGKLNHMTNAISPTSALSVNTLRLNGGDFVNGQYGYANDTQRLGGNCLMKIFNTLWFSGDTPHAFGLGPEGYPGCKSYSRSGTFQNYKISLNTYAPVEFRVDDITEGVDAYVDMRVFTWGTNTLGNFRSDLVKTGAGTLCFPSNYCFRPFIGDLTVKEGTVVFPSSSDNQYFFAATSSVPLQTIMVSTGATLRLEKWNLTPWGRADYIPNIKIVVDHGTLEYVTSDSNRGNMTARDWVFDDATLDIHNEGRNERFGIFTFRNSATFKGTRPLVMWPDENLDTENQAICVYNGYRTMALCTEDGSLTTIDVADMTGDGRTDVVMGYHIWNGCTNDNSIGVLTDSGFIKKGLGTFSVASMTNKVSGLVIVSNGTMRVDGSLVTPSAVNVAAGAYLGGTGTVARVSLEAGSGFDAPAGQTTPLTVDGDLALPATGVVNIANLEHIVGGILPAAKLATATGTISGTENLSNWTVMVDGVPTSSMWQLRVVNNVLVAKNTQGMLILFR